MKVTKLWIVLFRYRKSEAWIPDRAGRGGLDIIAYDKLKDARDRQRAIATYHQRGCVKVKMVGELRSKEEGQ